MKQSIIPGWLTLQGASAYCGLSTANLEKALSRGLIESRLVRVDGSTGGRRLIKRQSLDGWIESGESKTEPLQKTKRAAKKNPRP